MKRVIWIALAALWLVSCAPFALADAPIPVTRVTVVSESGATEVRVMDTLQLRAIVEPADATDPRVSWTSLNRDVARVSNDGVVTGLTVGRVTIRATALDGSLAYGDIVLDVLPELVKEIILSPADKALRTGGRWPIDARVVAGETADKTLLWSSDDPSIAHVETDTAGQVCLVAGETIGDTTIRAIAADGGGAAADLTVCVKTPATDVLVGVKEGSTTVDKGGSILLSAVVLPSDASDEVKWQLVDDPPHGELLLRDPKLEQLFRATKGGQALVRVTSQDGGTVYGDLEIHVRVPITGLALPDEANVFIRRTAQLAPVYTPEDTTETLLRWQSDDTSVVAVNDSGLLTGVSLGAAYVTARSAVAGDLVGMCLVRVTEPVRDIVLDRGEIVVGLNGQARVTAGVSPSDATDRALLWSSEDERVAVVSASGVVTGVSVGRTIVTAIARDGGGAHASVNVTVTDVRSALSLPEQMYAIPGHQFALTPVVTPAGLDPGALQWTSDAPRVASVDQNGLVTCLSGGVALIHVSNADGLSAACRVTVTTSLKDIAISLDDRPLPDVSSLDLGVHGQLVAVVYPLGAQARVRLRSLNPDIVAVAADGQFVALKRGVATIAATATGGDHASITRTVKLRVIQPVTSLLLPETITVLRGVKQAVKPVIAPKNASLTELSWRVGSDAVATVNQKGVLTGVSTGQTLLTASAHNGIVAVSRVTVIEPVSRVTLEKPADLGALYPGDRVRLQSAVFPENATQKLTYRTSDKNIATVDQNGVVTLLRTGGVRITAVASDGTGVKASVALKVDALVTKIKLSRDALTLYTNGKKGDCPAQILLKAAQRPKRAPAQAVLWSSSNEQVASIDQTGLVKAVADGTATVTAALASGLTDQLIVSVRTLPALIAFDAPDIELRVGEKADLMRRLTMDGSEPAVTWSSRKPAVARVGKNGVVTGLQPGTTTVIAKTINGLTASCAVRVTE